VVLGSALRVPVLDFSLELLAVRSSSLAELVHAEVVAHFVRDKVNRLEVLVERDVGGRDAQLVVYERYVVAEQAAARTRKGGGGEHNQANGHLSTRRSFRPRLSV